MPQKDFILREIEKIGILLQMLIRRLVEQKDKKEDEQSGDKIAEGFLDETGIYLEQIVNLDKSGFDTFFAEKPGFNIENIELLADFLVELSVSSTVSNPNAVKLKARELYEYVDFKSKTFSIGRAAKIERLNLE